MNRVNEFRRRGILLEFLSMAMDATSALERSGHEYSMEVYMQRVERFITQNYASIHVSDAAEYIGFTRSYFTTMFTKHIGVSPQEYIIRRINEDLVISAADAMAGNGLLDAGYEYVITDDCWSSRKRDENGHLVPDPDRFPHGIKAVADYVHRKGLKLGIYSCCGMHTCAKHPGSFEHEFSDAAQFAEWGIDYLKYDNCFRPSSVLTEILYRRMSMALRCSGRDILLST